MVWRSFLLVMLSACSLAIDVEADQCDSAASCQALGLGGACQQGVCVAMEGGSGGSGGFGGGSGGADPLWGCLGSVQFPEVDPAKIVTRTVTFRGVGTSVPEVSEVLFCDVLDLTCIDGELTTLEAGEDGVGEFLLATISAPEGSNGFLQITGPALKPTLLYPGPAFAGSATESAPVTLIEEALYDGLVMGAGFEELPAHGTLLALLTDCQGEPAAGVTISSPQQDDSSRPFYYYNELPSPDPTATAADGFSGILNLPTGTVTAESFNPEGVPIGKVSVQIREAWLTFTTVEPTP